MITAAPEYHLSKKLPIHISKRHGANQCIRESCSQEFQAHTAERQNKFRRSKKNLPEKETKKKTLKELTYELLICDEAHSM